MVIVIAFFCGLRPSAADKIQILMGDGTEIAEDAKATNAGMSAISSLNYITEVYTATGPSAGEPYNPSATKGFSAGETVYLTTRFYQATPGQRTVYYFISNSAGSVLAFAGNSYTATTGNIANIKTIIINTPGTYVFTPVILSDGNHMLPQSGFTFVVE